METTNISDCDLWFSGLRGNSIPAKTFYHFLLCGISEVIQIRKPDISFDAKAEGDVQILDISGQLDAFTVSDLKNELKKLTDARVSKIILSLSKVSYANSTAIGAIVATAQA